MTFLPCKNHPMGSIALAMLALVGATTCGCRTDASADAKADRDEPSVREWEIRKPNPTTMQTTHAPLPAAAQPTAVKRGRLPLVYLVETRTPIAVTNVTTEVRLAQATVPGRTIVRVDRSGVFIGDQRLAPGPLAADETYAIWIEPVGENVMRQGTIAPSRSPAREQRSGEQD
jgi:hypothetical protein